LTGAEHAPFSTSHLAGINKMKHNNQEQRKESLNNQANKLITKAKESKAQFI